MKKQGESLYSKVDGKYRPSPQQIEAVLRFLPKFEKRGFKAGRFVTKPGCLPYFDYAAVVNQFTDALYANGFVFPFNWSNWRTRHHTGAKLLRQAGLQTIRKLLCSHVRADRFCEGHLGAVIENGFIPAVLRRLQELNVKDQQRRQGR